MLRTPSKLIVPFFHISVLKFSSPGHPYGIPSSVTLKSKYKPISLGSAVSSIPLMNLKRSQPLLILLSKGQKVIDQGSVIVR